MKQDRQTDGYMDIATTRPKRPKGQFGEKNEPPICKYKALPPNKVNRRVTFYSLAKIDLSPQNFTPIQIRMSVLDALSERLFVTPVVISVNSYSYD